MWSSIQRAVYVAAREWGACRRSMPCRIATDELLLGGCREEAMFRGGLHAQVLRLRSSRDTNVADDQDSLTNMGIGICTLTRARSRPGASAIERSGRRQNGNIADRADLPIPSSVLAQPLSPSSHEGGLASTKTGNVIATVLLVSKSGR